MGEMIRFRCSQSMSENDDLHLLTGACWPGRENLVSGRDERLSSYLETLTAPAALLARDHTVLMSNSLFQEMAVNHEVLGARVGEVLSCMYASTLGKCGETVACLLCKLKRSVEQTWSTGEGLRGIPMSYPHRADARRVFTVTTEKVGDAVLLLLGTTERESC